MKETLFNLLLIASIILGCTLLLHFGVEDVTRSSKNLK